MILALVIPPAIDPPRPVFEMRRDGALALGREAFTPVFRPGTSATDADGLVGFRFDGRTGGISLGDPRSLRLTRSLSLAAWVRLERYASGAESQIVFRGDDRIGLDPYSLRVLEDGRVAFTVENARAQTDHVAAPIALHRWTHVLGSLDDRSGAMTLWIDGARAGGHRTRVRPFGGLDAKMGGGVAIGNVQSAGGYNQPLDGIVAGLGIYDRAVTPEEIRWSSARPRSPLRSFSGEG